MLSSSHTTLARLLITLTACLVITLAAAQSLIQMFAPTKFGIASVTVEQTTLLAQTQKMMLALLLFQATLGVLVLLDFAQWEQEKIERIRRAANIGKPAPKPKKAKKKVAKKTERQKMLETLGLTEADLASLRG